MATNKKSAVPTGRLARADNKGKACSDVGCKKPAAVKGRCVACDARDRRKDPAVREKAREASRRSYAKRAAAQQAEVAK